MTLQLFADESKRAGSPFTLAVVAIESDHVAAARKWLRSARMPNERTIHFTNEKNSRRRELLDGIVSWPWSPRLYIHESPERFQSDARDESLLWASELAHKLQANYLAVEWDQSRLQNDQSILTQQSRNRFRFGLHRAEDDALLWAADAMAWSWTHKEREQWRSRIRPLLGSDGLP